MAELGPRGAAAMTFDVAVQGEATAVVSVRGELDIANVEGLQRAVEPILTRTRQVVVDVSELRFADTSAIALWVRWAALVDELELRDASPLLRQVIRSMGLDQRLRLTP